MKSIASVERVIQAAAFVMFTAMFVLTLAQVVIRYFLYIPVPWTEEAARALFVLATLSGIALAYRRRQHIIVDFLFLRFPPQAMRWVSVAFAVLILAFLALWARGAIDLIGRNWTVGLITVGWFRVAYYYIWELAMIALLAVYVLFDLKNLITGRRTSLQAEGQETDLWSSSR